MRQKYLFELALYTREIATDLLPGTQSFTNVDHLMAYLVWLSTISQETRLHALAQSAWHFPFARLSQANYDLTLP